MLGSHLLVSAPNEHFLTFLSSPLHSIIFIHGIGGHPVKTWLHTPPGPVPLSPSEVTTTTTISTGGDGAHSPSRSRSLRSWVSSGSSSKKERQMVKKFQFSPAHRQHQQYRDGNSGSRPPLACDNEVTPWRSYSMSSVTGRGGPGEGRPFSSTEAEASTTMPGHYHERLIFSARASGIATDAKRPSPVTLTKRSRSHQTSPNTRVPLPVSSPTTTIRLASECTNGWPSTRQQLLDKRNSAANTTATYWPQDLLPNSCPNARVLVWGFKTITTYEGGYLVPGQFDVFARGRQLLESLEDLRRSYPTPQSGRSNGGRISKKREIVFVVHSTGGIIVKEVGGIQVCA